MFSDTDLPPCLANSQKKYAIENVYFWRQGKERGLMKSIEGGFEAIVLSGLYHKQGYHYHQIQIDYSGNIRLSSYTELFTVSRLYLLIVMFLLNTLISDWKYNE